MTNIVPLHQTPAPAPRRRRMTRLERQHQQALDALTEAQFLAYVDQAHVSIELGKLRNSLGIMIEEGTELYEDGIRRVSQSPGGQRVLALGMAMYEARAPLIVERYNQ